MKLSTETIEVLKNFSDINPSIIFDPGNVVRTIHRDMTILAEAEIKEEIPHTCAIYDLPKFLRIVSMFEHPDINWEDKWVTVKQNDLANARVVYADPEIAKKMIVSPGDQRINVSRADITFSLSDEQFEEIFKAASIMDLPNICVKADGKKQSIALADSKNDTTNTYEKVLGTTSQKYNMIFKVQNWNFLPKSYDITIMVVKEGKGVAHFKADNVQYWTTTESNSTYEN